MSNQKELDVITLPLMLGCRYYQLFTYTLIPKSEGCVLFLNEIDSFENLEKDPVTGAVVFPFNETIVVCHHALQDKAFTCTLTVKKATDDKILIHTQKQCGYNSISLQGDCSYTYTTETIRD